MWRDGEPTTDIHPGIRRRKDPPRKAILDELLEIYWDPSMEILDYAEACSRDAIHYQLWRNMVFAGWMAGLEDVKTRPYHVNLVRNDEPMDAISEFISLVVPSKSLCFRRATWGQLRNVRVQDLRRHSRLQAYLDNKTASLRPAFPAG